MTRADQRIAWACALVAVLAGLLSIVAANNGRAHATALIKVASTDAIAPLAASIDPDFVFVNDFEHYDGVYYYAIALDPLMTLAAHTLIDQPTYRYGRPMHGWLASIITLGTQRLIPYALVALSLLGMALAGWGVSRLCVEYGRTAWGGLVIAMSPGLLFAATVDTTETMGAALAVLTILAWIRGKPAWLMAVLSVGLAFYRESLVLVLLGIMLFELQDALRTRTRPDRRTVIRLAAMLVGPLLLVAWRIHVVATLGGSMMPEDPGNVGPPFLGWIDTFVYTQAMQSTDEGFAQIGTTTPPVLVAMLVLFLTALWVSRRIRSPFEAIFILQFLLMTLWSWRLLAYPHEWLREPVLTLLVALAVLLLPPDRVGLDKGATTERPGDGAVGTVGTEQLSP